MVSSSDIYMFLGITEENYFTITAGNDTLVIGYNAVAAKEVGIADGTYNGADLAAALETALDAAFSITSTVAYSSTTRKFTITAPGSNTFNYTHSGSDGGLTFGLNQDHAAAIIITSDIAAGAPTEIVDIFHDAVESFANSYCRRAFDSASYTREKYDGTGTRYLFLKNYPITALARITIGTANAIRIRNTSTYTKASVSVASTGLVLSKDGSTDSTLLFATYTTMTLLVAAINAIGSGWYAELEDSSYASFASSELIEKFGLSCIDSNDIDLKIPYEGAEYNFDVIANEGRIIFNRDLPTNSQCIFVDYTAGYSSSTIPDDLTLAIKVFVRNLYQKHNEETFGVNNFSLGDSSATLERVMPSEVRVILNRYKRRLV